MDDRSEDEASGNLASDEDEGESNTYQDDDEHDDVRDIQSERVAASIGANDDDESNVTLQAQLDGEEQQGEHQAIASDDALRLQALGCLLHAAQNASLEQALANESSSEALAFANVVSAAADSVMQFVWEGADTASRKKNKEVIMVEPFQVQLDELTSHDASRRTAAVIAISKLSVKNDPRVVAQLRSILMDSSGNVGSEVKSTALSAMSRLVHRGSKEAIDLTRAALEDTDPKVTIAALHALRALVVTADDCIVDAVCAVMDREDGAAWSFAVGTLLNLVGKGDTRVIFAMSSRLGHHMRHIRSCAIRSLPLIAEVSDPQVVQAVRRPLANVNRVVRDAAVEVLENMLRSSADTAIPLISKLLEKPDLRIMQGMVKAFVQVCGKSNDEVFKAVSAYIQFGKDASIRIAAIQAILELSDNGDERVVVFLGACLDDGDADIRNASMKAIVRLVGTGLVLGGGVGRQKALMVSSRQLRHRNPHIRATALQALEKLGRPGDKSVVALVIECLADQEDFVRPLAMIALSKLVEKNDTSAFTKISSLLKHADPRVRLLALEAVILVAAVDDHRAINVILERFKDPDANVRVCAMQTLASVAAASNDDIVVAIGVRLADPDPRVRAVAAEISQKLGCNIDQSVMHEGMHRWRKKAVPDELRITANVQQELISACSGFDEVLP